MSKIARIAGIAALGAAALSTSGIAGDEAATPVSFKAEIAPVLAAECAACHMMGNEPGELSLVPARARAQLVGVPSSEVPELVRVVPGKPEESYLVMKLAGTQLDHGGMGEQMPYGGVPLSDEVQGRIRTWISQGAADN